MIFVKWRRPLKNNIRILQRCCVNSNTSFRRPQSLCYSITFLCWPRIKKKSFRNPSDYTIIFSGPCFSAIWPFPFQAHCRLPKKKEALHAAIKAFFTTIKRTERGEKKCIAKRISLLISFFLQSPSSGTFGDHFADALALMLVNAPFTSIPFAFRLMRFKWHRLWAGVS